MLLTKLFQVSQHHDSSAGGGLDTIMEDSVQMSIEVLVLRVVWRTFYGIILLIQAPLQHVRLGHKEHPLPKKP